MQWMVARDHSDPQAIGTIDDTGNPKKGTHTPGVQRQWCGNTGKVDNCVVTVHIGYTAGDFHCLLDSAAQAADPSKVKNLATYSPVFRHQSWRKFKVKDGENGPMVWEVKHAEFHRKQADGLPGAPHTLIVARNVLNPEKVKYFLANRIAGAAGTSLEWMLWVAFSRWPIERCFEVGKRDLGLDHFEARNWGAIHRHLYISQLSLLFRARSHQRLREKNSGQSVFDRRAGAPGRRRVDSRPTPAAASPMANLSAGGRTDRLLPTTQSSLSAMPYATNSSTTEGYGH
jgi:SRSO17 transposase